MLDLDRATLWCSATHQKPSCSAFTPPDLAFPLGSQQNWTISLLWDVVSCLLLRPTLLPLTRTSSGVMVYRHQKELTCSLYTIHTSTQQHIRFRHPSLHWSLSWVYGLILARFWRVGCLRKQKRLITKVPPLVAIFLFNLYVPIHVPYRVIWPRLGWRELRWLWTLRRLRTVFLLRRALILGPSVQTVQSYQHAAFG